MVMTKLFLHIQDNNQTTFGTCQISYDITLSEQSDWRHRIYGGTNIFLHSFPDSFILRLADKTTQEPEEMMLMCECFVVWSLWT